MADEADPLISIPAAAIAIGVDRTTLGRQVRSGAVRSHGGKVRLSEVLADRAANIDLSRSKRRDGEIDRPEAVERRRPAREGDEDEDHDVDPDEAESGTVFVDGKPVSYADARALKETYLAKLKRLEFETKRGELAPVAEMVAFCERMFGVVRDRLLTIPGKLGGVLDRGQVERLRDEIYEAMEEISDPRAVLDEADALPRPDGDGDESDETAAAPQPRRMGRALPVRRAKDIRRPR